jgi:hypothetical protein
MQIHHDGIKASLEKVAAAAMASIEPNGVAHPNPLHPGTQPRCSTHPQEQMVAVIHEDVAVNLQPKLALQSSQEPDKTHPVCIRPEDVPALVSSPSHLIPSTCILTSQRTRHQCVIREHVSYV